MDNWACGIPTIKSEGSQRVNWLKWNCFESITYWNMSDISTYASIREVRQMTTPVARDGSRSSQGVALDMNEQTVQTVRWTLKETLDLQLRLTRWIRKHPSAQHWLAQIQGLWTVSTVEDTKGWCIVTTLGRWPLGWASAEAVLGVRESHRNGCPYFPNIVLKEQTCWSSMTRSSLRQHIFHL